jgi:hypothetical protein
MIALSGDCSDGSPAGVDCAMAAVEKMNRSVSRAAQYRTAPPKVAGFMSLIYRTGSLFALIFRS